MSNVNFLLYCTLTNKYRLMTVSKKFLKHGIENYKEMIEAHREEAKTYPMLKNNNATAIARLEGKIEAYEYFLKA